jgi:hypothetical protein
MDGRTTSFALMKEIKDYIEVDQDVRSRLRRALAGWRGAVKLAG